MWTSTKLTKTLLLEVYTQSNDPKPISNYQPQQDQIPTCIKIPTFYIKIPQNPARSQIIQNME